MKILRGKVPPKGGTPPKTTAAPPTPIIPPRAPASAKNKTRVLLTVTDGKIEWDKMTAESRKQFEAMVAKPEFLKAFGLISKSSEWDPEQVKQLYDGLGMLYQNLGRFVLQPPPQAIAVLGFSEAEKHAVGKTTAAMDEQYSGEFVKKHQALFVWGAIFMTINATKIKAALSIAQQIQVREHPQARVIPGAQPPRTPQPAAAPPKAPSRDPIPEMIPVAPAPAMADSGGESLEHLPAVTIEEGGL